MHPTSRSLKQKRLNRQAVSLLFLAVKSIEMNDAEFAAKTLLIRVAVSAQVIGYFLFSTILLVQDVPVFLREFGISELIWPIVVIIAMYFFKLDKLIARYFGRGLLTFFVLLISVMMLLATLALAVLTYDLLEFMRTRTDELLLAVLLIIGGYYALALLVNLFLISRMYRAERAGTSAT